MKRTSTAVWKGRDKKGKDITSQSRLLNHIPYASGSRFANAKGTNPEELIAAAHAGCFTMKLSYLVGEAGYTPEVIETTSEITLEEDEISHSHLTVKAVIPGMSKQKFAECAVDARDYCPVSKALNMIISMDASLTEMV